MQSPDENDNTLDDEGDPIDIDYGEDVNRASDGEDDEEEDTDDE